MRRTRQDERRLTPAQPGAGHEPVTVRVAPRSRAPAVWNGLLLAAFLLGLALRLWQLDIQIIIDDEWHAIHKLLQASPADILTHLGYADYSIPLTLYYQWLYRHVGLSEWSMHLPPLLASVALLLAGPRLLAREFALPTRAIWTLLVAISPLLVYHGKVARPYALTSLLTFVAVIAFRAWWLKRQRRDAVLYAGAAFFAGWLHAVTLPFTLLPFLYCGVLALRHRDGAALWRLARLGIATAALLGVALVPPVVSDWASVAGKAARDTVTAESAWRTLLMLAGTGFPLVGACLLAAALFGLRQLAGRDRDLAWYLATIVGAGAVVVGASGPEWIAHPLVLARYLLPALPFVLLFAAEGIATAVERLRRPTLETTACGVLAAGLFLAGPITGEWRYPNQFWGHLRYQFDYDPAHNPYVQQEPADSVPAFYRDLAQRPPGSVTLIEAPWRFESHFNAQALYQTVHRQLIRIGLTASACGVPDSGDYSEARTGMQMRELVQLTSVLRGDANSADYLVMHLKPGPVATDPGALWPDIRSCLPAIEARLGRPIYRDDSISVFALSTRSR